MQVFFFRTSSGREPVREWLKDLPKPDRKVIGEDIRLVQFRWPLGMPLVRKIEKDLWEVRSTLARGRIARVFFTVDGDEIILLHAFAKKSQKTPQKELNVAKNRRDSWKREAQGHE